MEQLLTRVRELREILKRRDAIALKQFSGVLAGESFLLQDGALLDLSLVSYALNKFLTQPYVFESKDWPVFFKRTGKLLEASENALKTGHGEKAREAIHSIIGAIDRLSDSRGRFVSSVVDKARLKAGAEIYAKGASLGQASFLSGSDKKDLAFYIGSTKLTDKFESIPLKQRFQKTMELFG